MSLSDFPERYASKYDFVGAVEAQVVVATPSCACSDSVDFDSPVRRTTTPKSQIPMADAKRYEVIVG